MPVRKRASRAKATAAVPASAPEVIVDVVFDRGLFHLVVANCSDAPAFDVTVQFDPPLRGLGGEVEVSALPLFRGIPFLAPQKRIATLLDTSSAWFARGEPTRLTAIVRFRDAGRRAFTRRIAHDLGIYRDLSYVLDAPTEGVRHGGLER